MQRKQGEAGRSMVEMLGVLAIIGVLSVMGVYGYNTAMKKHRANEIVQAASALVTMATSAKSGHGDCVELSKSGMETSIAGLSVEMTAQELGGVGVNKMSVHVQIKSGLDSDDIAELSQMVEAAVGANGQYEIVVDDESASCDE